MDIQTRILLVKLFYINGCSSTAALRKFMTEKNLRHPPFTTAAIDKLVIKFEEHGTVCDLPYSKRRCLTTDENVIETVKSTCDNIFFIVLQREATFRSIPGLIINILYTYIYTKIIILMFQKGLFFI